MQISFFLNYANIIKDELIILYDCNSIKNNFIYRKKLYYINLITIQFLNKIFLKIISRNKTLQSKHHKIHLIKLNILFICKSQFL